MVSVDKPDLQRMLKATKVVDEFIILTTAKSEWLNQAKPQLRLLPNSHLIEIDKQFIDHIKSNLTRNLDWDITIDQHCVSISDDRYFYHTQEFVWH